MLRNEIIKALGSLYPGCAKTTAVGEYEITVKLEYDQDCAAPWDDDGRGLVSEWTTRDKRSGERVLCADGNSKRFYDFSETVKVAKRDGWDAPPYKTGTRGEQAVRAVQHDFEYLRAWCNNEWCYVGVCVTVSRDGIEIGDDSLWHVESYGDYAREVAAENALAIIEQDIKETRERYYWAARDVSTIQSA